MEDSGGVQVDENKAFPEKSKGRQYKSKEQLQGLEDFYTEHKYPTESLKAEMAIKLNLTDKQVSGWFCHRRLKDKRLLKEESKAQAKQDLSSGIIQDRGSGLKQDSCSSTKQAEFRRADLREVDSQRFCQENLPVAELNYQQSVGDGNEMDDTSSESNSALQDNAYPQKIGHLPMETTEYQASSGFIQHSRGRVGPSGYLKIKGQTENAAITAVKRQLGRHYRVDGPSLGIEFDPLPPGAFESPSNTINDDAYGVTEPAGLEDILGTHKRPSLGNIRNEDLFESPEDVHLHKSVPDNFTFREPKQNLPYLNHCRGFPDKKSSFGFGSYSTYNSSRDLGIQQKHDLPGLTSGSRLEHPHSYSRKMASDPNNTFMPDYDNGIPKVVRRREQFSSSSAALGVRHKDPMYKDDKMPSNGLIKDEELHMGRRPTSEHHDSGNFKMHLTNELKANKRGREEFREEDYSFRSPSQDRALWAKQRKRPAEMPSSFSEDETAEASSSMD